jgi:transposase
MMTGAPWRDLPTQFGPFTTVHGRFTRWSRDGTWLRIQRALLRQLDENGKLDRELWYIDGSSIRASRAAATGGSRGGSNEPRDHALGRSRGGFGSKIHLVCDREGVPLAVDVSPGQRHESKWFERTMDSVRIPNARARAVRRPKRLGGDKGYSYPAIRRWLHRHRIDAVIPTRINQPRQETFDRVAYRGRNIVERCVGWLKEARRVATRFEQLAETFLGMLRLAIIRRLLRVVAVSLSGPSIG